ncbi:MAG: AsmA-like C-terminal region-containing protein [Ferruginibacter sp.]
MNWKKILKRTAITAACITGLYLLILFIAGIYINSKKESIIRYVTEQLKEKLDGKATISDLDISVWKHFPSIGFSIKGFSLSDSVYNKPILSVKSFSTSLSIFRLLSSKKTINSIYIEDGSFHLFTDSAGYSNQYLLKPKKNEQAGAVKKNGHAIAINNIDIKNLAVTIEDNRANKEISFVVNEMNASIDQQGKMMNIRMDEKISMKKGLGFVLSKGAYLEKMDVDAEWNLQMDTATKTLLFDKTIVHIDKHPYTLNGKFVFDKTYPGYSINIDTKDLPFEKAKAVVTDAIRQKIALVQMKMPLDVNGSIEGSLLPNHEPAVNINWQTKDNTLATPLASFSRCSFAGNFMNSVNRDSAHTDNNSRISFSSFSGDWDGVNLTGKDISITNLIEPQLHFILYSDCKLEALDNKFALKDISLKGGDVNLELLYDGPITKDNSMLEDLEGILLIKNGVIEYTPRNFIFTDCNGDVAFYKDSISMRQFTCSYLKNKFNVRVEGKNIRRKFVVNDLSQEAIVKCYVNAPYINLEDFNPLFAAPKQTQRKSAPTAGFAATALKLDNILANSIIETGIKAAAVKHGNMQAKNFEATIKFLPHHWELARVAIDIAGGKIVTNGKLIHNPGNTHAATIAAQVSNVDIRKLLYAFDNFGQDAIKAQHLRGSFTSKASLKTNISSRGNIVPASLFGTLDFSLKNGALENFPPFSQVKSFVFKNRDMSDVRFAEIKDKLEIKGTEVFINRMEIASNVCRLFVQGNYGLKGKNTDMLLQVPLSNLNDKNFTDEAVKNKGTKAKVGMSVWLRAINDDSGKVQLKLTLNKKLKNKILNDKLQKRLKK